MKPEQFTAWLRGFIELNGPTVPPTKHQLQIIKDHLSTVFQKITPNRLYENINGEPEYCFSSDAIPEKEDSYKKFRGALYGIDKYC